MWRLVFGEADLPWEVCFSNLEDLLGIRAWLVVDDSVRASEILEAESD